MIKLSSLTTNTTTFNPKVPLLEKTPTLEEKVTLNPQPLPPRIANPGSFSSYFAALQAQKLPQRATNAAFPSDWVTINPQPLPPKEQFASALTDSAMKQGIIIVGGRAGIR